MYYDEKPTDERDEFTTQKAWTKLMIEREEELWSEFNREAYSDLLLGNCDPNTTISLFKFSERAIRIETKKVVNPFEGKQKMKPFLYRPVSQNRITEFNLKSSLKNRPKNFQDIYFQVNSGRCRTQKFIRSIKALEYPSKLYCSFLGDRSFENRAFTTQFKNWKSLEGLTLFFETDVRQIMLKSFAHLSALTEFSFEINTYRWLIKEEKMNIIFSLFWSLQHMKHLKSLSISALQSIGLGQIPPTLLRLKQLQSLKLSFDGKIRSFDSQELIPLGSLFLSFPCLRSLSLSFENQKNLSDSALLQMFQRMNTLILEEFTLNLTQSQLISSLSIGNAVVLGIEYLKMERMVKISLHMDENCDDHAIDKLSQTLKKFTLLKMLEFSLSPQGFSLVSSKSIKTFNAILQSFPALSSVSFGARLLDCDPLLENDPYTLNCFFRPEFHNIKYPSLEIGVLNSLESIKIIFPIRIKNVQEFYQNFFDALMKKKMTLKSLELSFAFIPVECLHSLNQALLELVNLRHLVLDFENVRGPRSWEIEKVVATVRYLHYLRSLSLNFNLNHNIHPYFPLVLAELLTYLPHLHSLDFQFHGNRGTKEAHLDTLLKVIGQLVNIQEIYLDFDFNDPLNQKGLRQKRTRPFQF